MTIYEATLDFESFEGQEDDGCAAEVLADHPSPGPSPRSRASNIVPFKAGSPSLTPSVSMLELSTPEAVTAALTSAGNAFSHPVYVSELHQALTSVGTYEEELDQDYGMINSPTLRRSPRASPRVSPRSSPRVSRSGSATIGAIQPGAAITDVQFDSTAAADASEGARTTASSPERQMHDGAHMEGHLSSPPVVLACSNKPPPAAWFCADDTTTKTRYFVIQGSSSIEHWQINLQFEPVVFEHPSLGVRIHRGVYDAANQLYDAMLPLIQQHIATSPFATIAFTGHSLGGSLGTVLMLLLVSRGVVKPEQVSPVYTFGAPAVFCQGAVPEMDEGRCKDCHLECEMRPDRTQRVQVRLGPA
jgi:Lipase (class 3)